MYCKDHKDISKIKVTQKYSPASFTWMYTYKSVKKDTHQTLRHSHRHDHIERRGKGETFIVYPECYIVDFFYLQVSVPYICVFIKYEHVQSELVLRKCLPLCWFFRITTKFQHFTQMLTDEHKDQRPQMLWKVSTVKLNLIIKRDNMSSPEQTWALELSKAGPSSGHALFFLWLGANYLNPTESRSNRNKGAHQSVLMHTKCMYNISLPLSDVSYCMGRNGLIQ